MDPRTIENVLSGIPYGKTQRLDTPDYSLKESGNKVFAAVHQMKKHMTDEGWQMQMGLQDAGYVLSGCDFDRTFGKGTPVEWILKNYDPVQTLIFQDKREWMGMTATQKKRPQESFINCHNAVQDDLFRMTVLKDSHALGAFNREFCNEIQCHAWIVYYHPQIVNHLAPYTRQEDLIRTYHSIDSEKIPYFTFANKKGTFVSGALGGCYRLRQKLVTHARALDIQHLRHPGYKNNVPHTDRFLKSILRYRVSLCTTSIYGYCLRKIIESVACGCTVVTDLPVDDVLPHIDECLVRIHPDLSIKEIRILIRKLGAEYDPEKAEHFSNLAKTYYDYRYLGMKLAKDIDGHRNMYKERPSQ